MSTARRLSTVIKNTSSSDMFLGFIPPYGRKLAAGHEIAIPGSLSAHIKSRREWEAFEKLLAAGELEIVSMPTSSIIYTEAETIEAEERGNRISGAVNADMLAMSWFIRQLPGGLLQDNDQNIMFFMDSVKYGTILQRLNATSKKIETLTDQRVWSYADNVTPFSFLHGLLSFYPDALIADDDGYHGIGYVNIKVGGDEIDAHGVTVGAKLDLTALENNYEQPLKLWNGTSNNVDQYSATEHKGLLNSWTGFGFGSSAKVAYDSDGDGLLVQGVGDFTVAFGGYAVRMAAMEYSAADDRWKLLVSNGPDRSTGVTYNGETVEGNAFNGALSGYKPWVPNPDAKAHDRTSNAVYAVINIPGTKQFIVLYQHINPTQNAPGYHDERLCALKYDGVTKSWSLMGSKGWCSLQSYTPNSLDATVIKISDQNAVYTSDQFCRAVVRDGSIYFFYQRFAANGANDGGIRYIKYDIASGIFKSPVIISKEYWVRAQDVVQDANELFHIAYEVWWRQNSNLYRRICYVKEQAVDSWLFPELIYAQPESLSGFTHQHTSLVGIKLIDTCPLIFERAEFARFNGAEDAGPLAYVKTRYTNLRVHYNNSCDSWTTIVVPTFDSYDNDEEYESYAGEWLATTELNRLLYVAQSADLPYYAGWYICRNPVQYDDYVFIPYAGMKGIRLLRVDGIADDWYTDDTLTIDYGVAAGGTDLGAWFPWYVQKPVKVTYGGSHRIYFTTLVSTSDHSTGTGSLYYLPYDPTSETNPLNVDALATVSNYTVKRPAGIAVSGTTLYVVDKADNKIHKFNVGAVTPSFIAAIDFGAVAEDQIGDQGTLNAPGDIAFLSNGNYVVADTGNCRCQVFNSSDEFVATFGESELTQPENLCVDDEDNIYVIDKKHNRICVYKESDEEFQLLYTFSKFEDNPDETGWQAPVIHMGLTGISWNNANRRLIIGRIGMPPLVLDKLGVTGAEFTAEYSFNEEAQQTEYGAYTSFEFTASTTSITVPAAYSSVKLKLTCDNDPDFSAWSEAFDPADGGTISISNDDFTIEAPEHIELNLELWNSTETLRIARINNFYSLYIATVEPVSVTVSVQQINNRLGMTLSAGGCLLEGSTTGLEALDSTSGNWIAATAITDTCDAPGLVIDFPGGSDYTFTHYRWTDVEASSTEILGDGYIFEEETDSIDGFEAEEFVLLTASTAIGSDDTNVYIIPVSIDEATRQRSLFNSYFANYSYLAAPTAYTGLQVSANGVDWISSATIHWDGTTWYVTFGQSIATATQWRIDPNNLLEILPWMTWSDPLPSGTLVYS